MASKRPRLSEAISSTTIVVYSIDAKVSFFKNRNDINIGINKKFPCSSILFHLSYLIL